MGTYVRAEVLVSTFGPNNGVGNIVWNINAGSPHPEAMGVPFTPAHDSNLTQIDLGFYTFTANCNLNVKLSTDTGGAPGTVLQMWAVALPCIAYPINPCYETLLPNSGTTLLGGARYWIFVSAADKNTDVGWFWNPMNYENTVAFHNGGGWYEVTANVPTFDVIGTAATTPELGCLLLLATGLAAGIARYRKLHR